MRRLFSILLVVGACSAPSPEPPAEPAPESIVQEEWVVIGSMSGSDLIGQTHVMNTLEQAGIPAAIEGSVLYGISVPRRHSTAAAELLRDDAAGFVMVSWPTRPYPTWSEQIVNLRYEDAVAQLAADPRIVAALRDEHTLAEVADCPTVDSIETMERRYRGADGRWLEGLELRIKLVGPRRSGRLQFQSLAGGSEVRFQGSNLEGPSDASTKDR